jgi:HK97 family phage prohead protease
MMKLQYKTIELKDVGLKSEGNENTFSGYASVFNGNDLVGDTILPGAYKEAIKLFTPKMFFNHDSYELPIGKWIKVEEDEKGLKVVGELTPGNPQSEAVKAALKHGTVDGLSIGYRLRASTAAESLRKLRLFLRFQLLLIHAIKRQGLTQRVKTLANWKQSENLKTFCGMQEAFLKPRPRRCVPRQKSYFRVRGILMAKRRRRKRSANA